MNGETMAQDHRMPTMVRKSCVDRPSFRVLGLIVCGCLSLAASAIAQQASNCNTFPPSPGGSAALPWLPAGSDVGPGSGEVLMHETFENLNHGVQGTGTGVTFPPRILPNGLPAGGPPHHGLHVIGDTSFAGGHWGTTVGFGLQTSPEWRLGFTSDGPMGSRFVFTDTPTAVNPKPHGSLPVASNRLGRYVMGEAAANLRWRPGIGASPTQFHLVTPRIQAPLPSVHPSGEGAPPLIIEWDLALDSLEQPTVPNCALSIWIITDGVGVADYVTAFWFPDRLETTHFSIMLDDATGVYGGILAGRSRLVFIAHHFSPGGPDALYDWWLDNIKVSWRVDREPNWEGPQPTTLIRPHRLMNVPDLYDPLEHHSSTPLGLVSTTNNNLLLATELFFPTQFSPLSFSPSVNWWFVPSGTTPGDALSVDGPDEDNYRVSVEAGVPIQVDIHQDPTWLAAPDTQPWGRMRAELYRIIPVHEGPSLEGYPPELTDFGGWEEPPGGGEEGGAGEGGSGPDGGEGDDPPDGTEPPPPIELEPSEYYLAREPMETVLVCYDDGLPEMPLTTASSSLPTVRLLNGQYHLPADYLIRTFTVTGLTPPVPPFATGLAVAQRIDYEMFISHGHRDYYSGAEDPTEAASPTSNNDEKFTATPVLYAGLPTVLAGVIHPGDVDYFEIIVPADSLIGAVLTPIARLGADITGAPLTLPLTVQDELQLQLIAVTSGGTPPAFLASKVVDIDETPYIVVPPATPIPGLVEHALPFATTYYIRVSRFWQHSRTIPDTAISYSLEIINTPLPHSLAIFDSKPRCRPPLALISTSFTSPSTPADVVSRVDETVSMGIGLSQERWIQHYYNIAQPTPAGGFPLTFQVNLVDTTGNLGIAPRDYLWDLAVLDNPFAATITISPQVPGGPRPSALITYTPPTPLLNDGSVFSFTLIARDLQYDRDLTPDDPVTLIAVDVRFGSVLIRPLANPDIPTPGGTPAWGIAPHSLHAHASLDFFAAIAPGTALVPGLFSAHSSGRGTLLGDVSIADAFYPPYPAPAIGSPIAGTHVSGLGLDMVRSGRLRFDQWTLPQHVLIAGSVMEYGVRDTVTLLQPPGVTTTPDLGLPYTWRAIAGGLPPLPAYERDFATGVGSTVTSPLTSGRSVYTSAVGDMDGDGHADLVISRSPMYDQTTFRVGTLAAAPVPAIVGTSLRFSLEVPADQGYPAVTEIVSIEVSDVYRWSGNAERSAPGAPQNEQTISQARALELLLAFNSVKPTQVMVRGLMFPISLMPSGVTFLASHLDILTASPHYVFDGFFNPGLVQTSPPQWGTLVSVPTIDSNGDLVVSAIKGFNSYLVPSPAPVVVTVTARANRIRVSDSAGVWPVTPQEVVDFLQHHRTRLAECREFRIVAEGFSEPPAASVFLADFSFTIVDCRPAAFQQRVARVGVLPQTQPPFDDEFVAPRGITSIDSQSRLVWNGGGVQAANSFAIRDGATIRRTNETGTVNFSTADAHSFFQSGAAASALTVLRTTCVRNPRLDGSFVPTATFPTHYDLGVDIIVPGSTVTARYVENFTPSPGGQPIAVPTALQAAVGATDFPGPTILGNGNLMFYADAPTQGHTRVIVAPAAVIRVFDQAGVYELTGASKLSDLAAFIAQDGYGNRISEFLIENTGALTTVVTGLVEASSVVRLNCILGPRGVCYDFKILSSPASIPGPAGEALTVTDSQAPNAPVHVLNRTRVTRVGPNGTSNLMNPSSDASDLLAGMKSVPAPALLMLRGTSSTGFVPPVVGSPPSAFVTATNDLQIVAPLAQPTLYGTRVPTNIAVLSPSPGISLELEIASSALSSVPPGNYVVSVHDTAVIRLMSATGVSTLSPSQALTEINAGTGPVQVIVEGKVDALNFEATLTLTIIPRSRPANKSATIEIFYGDGMGGFIGDLGSPSGAGHVIHTYPEPWTVAGQSNPFQPAITPLTPFASSIALWDLNGDGFLDVVAAARHFDSLCLQNPALPRIVLPAPTPPILPLWTAPPLLVGPTYGTSVLVGDFDGDGKGDLVFTREYTAVQTGGTSPSSVCLPPVTMMNQSTLQTIGLAAPIAFPSIFDAYFIGHRSCIGDIDGNGVLDVAVWVHGWQDSYVDPITMVTVPGYHYQSAQWYLGQGNGTFSLGPVIPRYTEQLLAPYSMIALDVDGDHRCDTVLVMGVGNTVTQIIEGFVDAFSGPTLTPIPRLVFQSGYLGPIPRSAVAGDVDGDGFVDLIITNMTSSSSGSGSVLVLYNTGVSSAPYSVAVPPSGANIASLDIQGGYPNQVHALDVTTLPASDPNWASSPTIAQLVTPRAVDIVAVVTGWSGTNMSEARTLPK